MTGAIHKLKGYESYFIEIMNQSEDMVKRSIYYIKDLILLLHSNIIPELYDSE